MTSGREATADQRGTRPRLGVGTLASATVALLVVNEFAGLSAVATKYLPGSPFTLLLLLSTGAAALVVWQRRQWPPTAPLVVFGCYVLALALSQLLSPLDPETTASAVNDGLKEFYFLALLLVLGVGLRRWPLIAAAMVLPVAVIGWLTAASEFALGGTATFLGFVTPTEVSGVDLVTSRYAGPLLDANFWGRFLVVVFPFSLALLVHTVHNRRWIAGLATVWTIGGILLAVYLTGSRGTFLALGVGLLVFALLVRRYRPAFLTLVAMFPLALLVPGIGNRLLSVAGLVDSGQRAGVDSSVLERVAAQQVAVQMILTRPMTGVGPGGYVLAFPDYAHLTGLAFRRVVAPHNGYLGVAAEIGIVGLLCWLAMIVLTLARGMRAVKYASRATRQDVVAAQPYAVAIVSATVAWLAATVFLHVTYPRVFLILLALAALLDREVIERVGRLPPVVLPARRLAAMAGAVVLAAGLGVGGVRLADANRTSRVEMQIAGVLQPRTEIPYLIALRTREAAVPTFAAVISATDPAVQAQGDPQSGRITVVLSAPTETAARQRLAASLATGEQALAGVGLGRLYSVQWEGTPVVRQPQSVPYAVAAALGAGLLGPPLVWLIAVVGRRRDRRPTTAVPGRQHG